MNRKCAIKDLNSNEAERLKYVLEHNLSKLNVIYIQTTKNLDKQI